MAKVSCCKYLTVSLVPAAALFLAVVFGVGTLTLPILFSELTKKYEYGIVIDAGSSHTTLYVYEVEVPLNGNVRQIHFIKQDDHLDSYVNDTSQVGPMLVALVNSSLDEKLPNDLRVPAQLMNTTHIYVGATAGMRLLKLKDKKATGEILHQATHALRSAGFFMEERARIISGQEEAAGGWATANYLSHTLKTGEIGSLDMGGASTEIAFKVDHVDESDPFYTRELLFNYSYPVYARSYLCYGHVESHARFLGHLMNANKSASVFSNPCHPVGYKSNHTFSSINTSCVVEPIAEEAFGHLLTLPSNYSSNDNVSFIGTGNYSECLLQIMTAFNFNACKPNLNCPKNSSSFSVPPSNGTFIGYSGFHYIAKQFNLTKMTFNKHSPKGGFTETFKDICKSNLKVGTSSTMCFYGILMGYMMEEGFGFKNTSSNDWEVRFKSRFAENMFGWSLGYLMNKTTAKHYNTSNGFHEARPFTTVDLVVGMIILTLLCAIFVIFFFLTFYACKKALEAHGGYQTIS